MFINQLREKICELTFLADDELTPELNLFSEGYLDSVSLLELVSFIETSLSIRIATADLSLDNFDTLARIINYLKL